MMMENYVDGDLGPAYNAAMPLTLTVVSQLLHAREAEEHDAANHKQPFAYGECREAVNLLVDPCASEITVATLRRMRLRLKTEVNAMNAHLANFVFDDEGNARPAEPEEVQAQDHGPRQARLHPFEVVAVGTLMPKSVDEAVQLIPSLARYEEDELQQVVDLLERDQ